MSATDERIIAADKAIVEAAIEWHRSHWPDTRSEPERRLAMAVMNKLDTEHSLQVAARVAREGS